MALIIFCTLSGFSVNGIFSNINEHTDSIINGDESNEIRSIVVAGLFRLRTNYVNYKISLAYLALLHNLNLRGVTGDDEVLYFRLSQNIKVSIWYPKLLIGNYRSYQNRTLANTCSPKYW